MNDQRNPLEVPGAPKNEILWVQGYSEYGDLRYIITSTKTRERYTLYFKEGGELKKKFSASSPLKFEKYI